MNDKLDEGECVHEESYTNLSIGVIMKGIVESPMAVVVHFRAGKGHLVLFPNRYREAAQTRLMVKPGMITEASACHTKVSTTATATRVVFPGLSPCAWRNKKIKHFYIYGTNNTKQNMFIIWKYAVSEI